MASPRTRPWLIVVGVLLAVGALVLAVVGPWALRHVFRPIAQMRASQNEFQDWVKSRAYQEPPAPAPDEARLAVFLALRRDLIEWQQKMEGVGRSMPQGRRPSFGEIAGAMEGVGELVGGQLESYKRHDMTPAEYRYWRRIVYETWLAALVKEGADPAARGRAAHEIEVAAEAEKTAAAQARLKDVAASLRARVPAAPEGIPPAVHTLLLAHAAEIQTLAVEPRGSSERRPRRSVSP